MSELEQLLLNYYRSQPIHSLTAQEVDEMLYLEVKLGLEGWQREQHTSSGMLLPISGETPAGDSP